ncbi:phage tail protein [Schleiferilactobacillus harbinensis]|uniref:Phage-related major tail protein n=1 Tax=Schleiferilactobacillus harbinensis DSM 16991 TaxID=1122147 RepID=A0A0R1X0B6_9LACO|nr:phage tail protein [Schleiferilactobacillus harbinensis]KRM23751.1 phage-related major tail protein [Schleiferilactobacillus harbinensis DSM 16991]QFR64568.1 phage tail protein [Schleiferilactobacillus harbinensis]
MATVGLYGIAFALVDQDQKLITGTGKGLGTDGIYVVSRADLGGKTANITGLDGTPVKTYGFNRVQAVDIPQAEPSVALDINDLNFAIKQQIKGMINDQKGGYTDQGIQAHVAMLITTQTLNRLNYVYYGFGDGILSEPSANLQTNTNAIQKADDALTYTALTTDAFNGAPYKLYSDLDANFDKANMYKEVFGGYVLPTPPAGGSASGTGSGTTTH